VSRPTDARLLMTDAMPKILTLEEVAEITRTSPNTLRFWRSQGTTGPRSFRIGKRVMYREEDVLAWIQAQYDEGGPTT
jgi:predicted DNA-binding transcriptional regulator AlpA